MTLNESYSKIKEKKQELDKRRPLSQGEAERLKQDFAIEYTYNSNAIEGNTLTLRETAMVFEGLTIANKALKDHLEAMQHRDAFWYVCDLAAQNEQLSEKVIQDIHSIVLNDRMLDRGVYRRVAVRILGAVHIPPNPIKIANLMQELVSDYNNNAKGIKEIATFHVAFERIHPFIDGNGRTGRLLANLELMKQGYPPIDIKFATRKEYYDSLNEFTFAGNTERFEQLFAGYVLQRLEEYLEIIK